MTIFSFLGALVPGSWPEGIKNTVSKRTTPLATVVSDLAPAARRAPGAPHALRAAVVGPPNSGKSTLLNHIASMICDNRAIQAYFSQAQAGAQQHVTVQIRDVSVANASGHEVISLRDTQGIYQLANLDPILALMVSGILDPLERVNVELLPFVDSQRPQPALDDENGVNAYVNQGTMNAGRVSTAIQGGVSSRKALVVFIIVNAVALMDTQRDAILLGIRDFCISKCQFPGTVHRRDIQCHLIVTKVDAWSRVSGWFWNSGPSCLLKQQNGVLGPLFKRAKQLGFDAPHVTAIGWLDEEFEHCNTNDPRTIVLRRIVEIVAEKSNTQLVHLHQTP